MNYIIMCYVTVNKQGDGAKKDHIHSHLSLETQVQITDPLHVQEGIETRSYRLYFPAC